MFKCRAIDNETGDLRTTIGFAVTLLTIRMRNTVREVIGSMARVRRADLRRQTPSESQMSPSEIMGIFIVRKTQAP